MDSFTAKQFGLEEVGKRNLHELRSVSVKSQKFLKPLCKCTNLKKYEKNDNSNSSYI